MFTAKSLKDFLAAHYVIEIEQDKLSENFHYNADYEYFIRRVLLFSMCLDMGFLASSEDLKHIRINPYSEFMLKGHLGLHKIYEGDDGKVNIVNFTMLEKLANFLSKEDEFFNYNYFDIIQTLLTYNSVRNDILNKVSIIERLLLTKFEGTNQLLQEHFSLKVGTLCFGLFDNVNVVELRSLLKELYQLRSDIVHGNWDKLVKDKASKGEKNRDEYKTIIGKGTRIYAESLSLAEKAGQVLYNARDFLDKILIRILNKYIDEPQFCKFLKGGGDNSK